MACLSEAEGCPLQEQRRCDLRLASAACEVGNRHDTKRVDEHYRKGPPRLRAAHLACGPPHKIDQGGSFQDSLGGATDGDQSACAGREIVPFPPAHQRTSPPAALSPIDPILASTTGSTS